MIPFIKYCSWLYELVFVFCKHLPEFITQLKQGQKTEQTKYLPQMLFRAV